MESKESKKLNYHIIVNPENFDKIWDLVGSNPQTDHTINEDTVELFPKEVTFRDSLLMELKYSKRKRSDPTESYLFVSTRSSDGTVKLINFDYGSIMKHTLGDVNPFWKDLYWKSDQEYMQSMQNNCFQEKFEQSGIVFDSDEELFEKLLKKARERRERFGGTEKSETEIDLEEQIAKIKSGHIDPPVKTLGELEKLETESISLPKELTLSAEYKDSFGPIQPIQGTGTIHQITDIQLYEAGIFNPIKNVFRSFYNDKDDQFKNELFELNNIYKKIVESDIKCPLKKGDMIHIPHYDWACSAKEIISRFVLVYDGEKVVRLLHSSHEDGLLAPQQCPFPEFDLPHFSPIGQFDLPHFSTNHDRENSLGYRYVTQEIVKLYNSSDFFIKDKCECYFIKKLKINDKDYYFVSEDKENLDVSLSPFIVKVVYGQLENCVELEDNQKTLVPSDPICFVVVDSDGYLNNFDFRDDQEMMKLQKAKKARRS